MGQRANLVLVENGETTVYYNHWCANRLETELFFGPSQAKRFIAAQEVVDDDGWLDEVWAEGGAALDLDNRRLVWYGGEEVLYEIPLRRVLIDMMREVWRGYTVGWAHEGLAGIADSAGVPRSKVLNPPKPDDGVIHLLGESDGRFGVAPASVRWEDGRVMIYPYTAVETFVTLLNGPQIVDQLRSGHARSQYCAGRDGDALAMPSGGFHLDLETKTMTFWQAQERANAVERLVPIWAGWTVCWERDRFECQAKLTDGALTFLVEPPHQLAKRVCEIVLHRSKPVDPYGIVKVLEAQGHPVTRINPMINMDTHVEVDPQMMSEIAGWALQQFLAKSSQEPNDNAGEMS